MSEKIATKEKVEDAILRLKLDGTKPSADRVLAITGGSKTTVLPLYNEAVRAKATMAKSDRGNSAMPPPQELQDAVAKACKAITAIPALFMDELCRYDRIIGHHSNEVLLRETAIRDERIASLESELEIARRGEQELRERLRALERQLAWATKYVGALEVGLDATQAPRIAHTHAAAVSEDRQSEDHAEPLPEETTAALSNASHRHHSTGFGDANDDW